MKKTHLILFVLNYIKYFNWFITLNYICIKFYILSNNNKENELFSNE